MSLLVTYKAVCDLCKKELHTENYELALVPGFNSRELPVPNRMIMQHVFYINESQLMLCHACAGPVVEALHKQYRERPEPPL